MIKEIKIDFVVTWLDANDPEWIKTYHRYRGGEHLEDNGRYRNWDIFRYWFRAVECYAPWVNKVFLVTNGKFPDWINPSHPKLVLVKHSDYMPEKYLPTFNSRAIELNFHRIKGLSEHFVYFNDDMFINTPVQPQYYFKKGLPCDSNEETLFINPLWDPQNKFSTKISLYCNMAYINYHFDRKKVIKEARAKWLGPHLGLKGLFTSLLIGLNKKCFQYFQWRHYEQPMLKSVIEEIWDVDGDMADSSCTKFRQDISFNPYIIRYWQLASNRFSPMRLESGTYFTIGTIDTDIIVNSLKGKKYHSICLNDNPHCTEKDFNYSQKAISETLSNKFPQKSQFEK